jgi:glyoxylase-like metal-dependent hydrolase (beta-lactamase superfamily II)
MTVIIDASELWAAATNCYVVAPEAGGPAVVVDAPPDPDGIGALLARHDLTPVALLISHGHIDHVGGAGAFAATRAVTTYLHPEDDFMSRHPAEVMRLLFGVELSPESEAVLQPPADTVVLEDGQHIEAAGLGFDVLHTPGHSPGHCCFYLAGEGVLFSADQLFAGSIGRTDLPGGDLETLLESMRTKVLTLPEDTRVLPGHGPATTLAAERRTNPFLQGLLQH